MALLLAWMVGLAAAQGTPDDAVLRQQQAVEVAAQAVAAARADGAKRSVIAELMKHYRAEATELDALLPPLDATWEEERRARLQAVIALGEALAAGKSDDDAAEVLAAWLGEPSDRLTLLRKALASTETAPDTVRAAVQADVAEQATALSVWLAYDAAEARRRAEKAQLRAASLRRSGPGQGVGISAEVEAQQLEALALVETTRSATLSTLRTDVLALRAEAAIPRESP